MLLKKQVMKWIYKMVATALIAGFGLSVTHASCTASICRAKGSLYDCHAVPDTPEWICRKPEPKPAETSAPAHAPEHHSGSSSTLPSIGSELSHDRGR